MSALTEDERRRVEDLRSNANDNEDAAMDWVLRLLDRVARECGDARELLKKANWQIAELSENGLPDVLDARDEARAQLAEAKAALEQVKAVTSYAERANAIADAALAKLSPDAGSGT
jgi:predicted translin family RNA/ssDNA-binding protein